jgi:putative transposase
MDTRKTQLKPECFYHIYNRGINGCNIFIEDKNYDYFLLKYAIYVYPFVETHAYCLLKNHFHFLIKVRSESEIRSFLNGKNEAKTIEWIISNAFSSLFKSYSQAINKVYNRSGGLFEEPFHRIEIDNNKYLSKLIWYIHYNPQKHGFVSDFRDYPFSSYHSFLSNKMTKLEKDKVIFNFGDLNSFINYHSFKYDISEMNEIVFD